MWQTKYKENSTHEGFDPNFWWKKILSLKSVTDKRKRKFYSWEILSQLLTKEILNSEKVWQTKDKENSTYEGFDPNFQLKKILALKSVTDKKKENSTYQGFDPNFRLKKILTLKSVTDKRQRKFYSWGIWS